MNQLQLRLLARIDGPAVAPAAYLKTCATYRQAVRMCWALRRVHHMTLRQLACEAELRPQLVSDYLHEDDAARRRNLPAADIARFESVAGNTLITQWLAARQALTVLEEMQASKLIA